MMFKSIKTFRWKSVILPWQQADLWLLLLPLGLSILGGIMIRSTELNQIKPEWWMPWVFALSGLAAVLVILVVAARYVAHEYWQQWLIGGIAFGLILIKAFLAAPKWSEHILIAVVGICLMLLCARWRYENLIKWHWIIYGITNLSLVFVMIAGTSAKGAQRWIAIGSFNVQPSEFAKLSLIITLAVLLSAKDSATMGSLVRSLAITAVPWGLVFLQPDLGTSLVFGAITLGMLYWANVNPGWLLLLSSPLVSAILFNVYLPGWCAWSALMALIAWKTLPWPIRGAVGAVAINLLGGEAGHIFWGLLKDYQKNRIITFLNPEHDPLGSGYHLIQSRIAIGSGELWGRGLYHGTQTQGNFVPEQHTDFIFSAIGEELGFVGCIAVLLAFWFFCLRLVMIAESSKSNFGSLLAIGVLAMIVFQVIVNIGMTIGMAPVTGIPLPWVSYGRSAMLTNFIAVGLVESVANYRQRLKF
ncbi:rod shape-determining protein RodA [Aerosakkonemataceae cyanobacterium BLCC-F50]|uniref:Peptidoglycan glycosyltransferase RodA n=1 Tax=Floridaenema flaviceps BLCC-F50 TaxID=3153642 RepID=A0ABV4XPJ9_9CYAN